MTETYRAIGLLSATALVLLACNGRVSTSSGGAGLRGGSGGSTGAGASGNAGGASENTGGASENTGGASENTGGASGNTGGASGNTGGVPVCGSLITGYAPPQTDSGTAVPPELSRTLVSDGCNTCACDNGDWKCTTKACAGYPPCPTEPPNFVDNTSPYYYGLMPCGPMVGQICAGWGSCSPVCQCNGAQWHCEWPSCFCPAVPPNDPNGVHCTTPDLYCAYGNSACYKCYNGLQGNGWLKVDCR